MSFVIDFVEDVIDFVGDIFSGIVDFVADAFDFVFNGFGAVDTPEVKNPAQEAQGVTVSKTGTNNPIPIVYGHRLVGGNIVFVETNGTDNKFLYVVYAICEGDIEGVVKVMVDDNELPNVFKTVGNGTYPNANITRITSGAYNDRIQFQIFNGTDNQAQSGLANEAATWKKKKRTMPGITYAAFRFEWKPITNKADADNNPYKGGIPQVKFEVLGRLIYDVRRHDTATYGKNLSDSTPNYSDLLKRYNFNPANCLLDYLMNPRYGAGLPREKIDAESFKIAAQKFEQRVNYSNSQSGRIMTCNAVILPDQTLFNNIKTLVAACRGIMPYVQGRYTLIVEDGGNATDITSSTYTSAFDVTEDEIIGSITLSGEKKRSKYNQVVVNYIDPDKEFSNQQAIYQEDPDVGTDNNEPLIGEFTFHTITNPLVANDLARMLYKKSRNQRQIAFTATPALLNIIPGNIIRVSSTILDLDQVAFRVVSMNINQDNTINIEGVEHDPSVYPYITQPEYVLPAPLYLPYTFNIQPKVQELPFNPFSLQPRFDPDYDSAGDPLASIDENTPPSIPIQGIGRVNPQILPPVPEIPILDGRVTSFDNFTKQYNNNYYLGRPTAPQAFTNNGKYGLAYVPPTSKHRFNLSRLGLAGGGGNTGFAVYLICPSDSGIDQLILESYINKQLQSRSYIELRNNPSLGTIFPDGYMPSPLFRNDIATGLYHPLVYMFKPAENVRYRIKYRKDGENLEYEDGSDLSETGEFISYTYTNYNEEIVTGSNLEAFFAYLQNVRWNQSTSSLQRTFVFDFSDLIGS